MTIEHCLTDHQQTLPSKLDANGQSKNTEMSTGELMKAPGVAIVVFIYSHVIFQALCFTAGMLHPYTLTLGSLLNMTFSNTNRTMDPSPPRRLGILFPMDLHHSSPRRLQPSSLDALRLPLPAAQDEHRHCLTYLLHCMAHRNGSIPFAQRTPPRRPPPCVLDSCVHHHLPRIGYCDVVRVHPALLERYCAEPGHVGYAECCGFDY